MSPTDKTPYVEFDEKGLAQARCMQCLTPMIQRKPQRDAHGQYTGAFRVVCFPAFHQVPVQLSDGSVARLFLCRECEKVPNWDAIMRQMKLGWTLEFTQVEASLDRKKAALRPYVGVTIQGVHRGR